MERLISAADLVSAIRERMNKNQETNTIYASGAYYEDGFILDLINSLGTKEVDCEREIGMYTTKKLLQKRNKVTNMFYLTQGDIDRIAKHFYELGLSTKSLIDERIKDCPYKIVGGCGRYSGIVAECNGACAFVVDYLKLKELKAKKGE